jgi:XRE family aerobic/anaerobic benzoate catabolism transcriptional regulator
LTGAPLLAEVGSRVRALRRARGWTVGDLARTSGSSERFLADVEHGRGNASLLRLSEIAQALGVSLATLVAGLGPVNDAADVLAGLPPERRALALRAGRSPEVLALVGLRGAGKSTVGALLARSLGWSFVELDAAVEERAGVRLGDIFEFAGAARYRELEREVLGEVLDRPPCGVVLATGGSLVTAPDTWRMLRASARTVWLRASPEAHLARVEAQGDVRPMRGRENARAELEAILAARSPAYAQAEVHLDTDGRAPDVVVAEIQAWVGETTRSLPR